MESRYNQHSMSNSLKNTLLALLAVAALAFSYAYQEEAFPELSPEFSKSRAEIEDITHTFARQFGFDTSKYQHATIFGQSSTAKNFLELEYGTDELRKASRDGVNLWYWSTRYFIPGELKEMSLRVDTEGRLKGAFVSLPEKMVLPKIGKEKAEKIARQFIADNIGHHPLDSLKLTEADEKQKPGHDVYRFTWERSDWEWGDGKYHVHVSVSGDRITRYHEHLDVPEAWSRKYRKLRSENNIYQTIATTGMSIIGIGIVIMFIMMMVRHEVHWNGFPYRWLLPVGSIMLLSQLSDFPSILYSYQTQDDLGSHVASGLLGALYGTLSDLVSFMIIAFVADACWQKTFPHHTPIRSLLNGKGLATAESMRAVGLGFVLATLTLAYVTAYYMLGDKFGIWTPSSIDYGKVMTSYLPSIEALSVGISAAWNEELLFRVLGVVLVYRLTGSLWAAVLINAAVWGFLHSNYPQLPAYSRGIELTIEGIALGWVAIRYGILTTFISHCLYNTWLGAMIAWQTGSSWHMAMAVLVSTWPVLLWVWGRHQQKVLGRIPEPAELVQGSKPLTEQIHDVDAILHVRHLPIGWRQLTALTIVGAGLIMAMNRLPESGYEGIGDVSIHRQQAEAIAMRQLQKHLGDKAADYKAYTRNSKRIPRSAVKYMLEHASAERIAKQTIAWLYEEYWVTTFFIPEQRDHYKVYLKPDGELFLFHRSVAETTEGASLKTDEAIKLAAKHLETSIGVKPADYRYISESVTKRKNRRDYWITFESTRWAIGDSRLRWRISLLGDQFNSINRYLKLPEDYTRKKSSQGWKDTIQELISYTALVLLGIGFFMINGIIIVRHFVPWRTCLKLAAIFPLLIIIDRINLSTAFYGGYSTTQTMLNYVGTWAMRNGVSLLSAYLTGVLSFAGVFGLGRWLTGTDLKSIVVGYLDHNLWQRLTQGLFMGVFGLLLISAYSNVTDFLSFYIKDDLFLTSSAPFLEGHLPSISLISGAINGSISQTLVSVTLFLIIFLLWNRHRQFLLVLAILVLVSINLEWETWGEVLYGVSMQTGKVMLLLWLFTRVFRYNPFAYLIMFYYESLLPQAIVLTGSAWPAYSTDIVILWIAVLLPILLAIPGLFRQETPQGQYA